MRIAESRSTVYSIEEGILVSTIKEGVVMNSADAKENYEVRQTLNLDWPIPFLMDIRNLPDMTFESIRETGKQPDRENFSAAALLVNEAIHLIVARESKRLKENNTPYRIFENRLKAITWLKSFQKTID